MVEQRKCSSLVYRESLVSMQIWDSNLKKFSFIYFLTFLATLFKKADINTNNKKKGRKNIDGKFWIGYFEKSAAKLYLIPA